jgi:hypothetical protein
MSSGPSGGIRQRPAEAHAGSATHGAETLATELSLLIARLDEMHRVAA